MRKKLTVWLLLGSSSFLALVGGVYAWMSPWDPLGSHWAFSRLICWNAIGACFGVMAYMLEWKHWKKVSAAIPIIWFGLLLWSLSLPPVSGTSGWIPMGVLAFNVWEFSPLAIGFAGVAASECCRMKARPVLAALALGLLGAVAGVCVTRESCAAQVHAALSGENAASLEKVRSRAYQVDICRRAVKESKWIGRSDFDVKYLPERMTSCMPAAASVLFGRFYLCLLVAGALLMGVGFVCAWRAVSDEPGCVLVAVTGIGTVGKAMLCIFGQLGYLPFGGHCVPFATFFGSLAIATSISLGLICTAMKEVRGEC